MASLSSIQAAASSPVSLERRGDLHCPTDVHFQFSDIALIAKKAIGLRHVSQREQVEKEMREGMIGGCSFNLSFQPPRSWHSNIPSEQATPHFVNLPLQLQDAHLSEQFKQERVKAYEEAIDQFIEGSLLMDFESWRGSSVKEICKKLENTGFLLLDYQDIGSPVDLVMYHNLGRFPSYRLSPNRVKGSLPFFDLSCIQEENPHRILRTQEDVLQFGKKILDWHRAELLKFLRENHEKFADASPDPDTEFHAMMIRRRMQRRIWPRPLDFFFKHIEGTIGPRGGQWTLTQERGELTFQRAPERALPEQDSVPLYSRHVATLIDQLNAMRNSNRDWSLASRNLSRLPFHFLTPIVSQKLHELACSLDRSHPSHFQFSDILFLENRAIGLRHVSSQEQVEKEKQEGVEDGCSFNLSFLPSEHWDEEVPPEDQYNHYVRLPLQIKNADLDENFKQERVRAYEKAVSDCISDSLVMDIGAIDLGKTTVGEICQLLERTGFLLLDYATPSKNKNQRASLWGRPTDIESYHNLGRFPKTSLRPQDVKGSLPFFNIQWIGENPERVIQTREEGGQLYQKIIDWYRTELLKFLRTHHDRFADIGPIDFQWDYRLKI